MLLHMYVHVRIVIVESKSFMPKSSETDLTKY